MVSKKYGLTLLVTSLLMQTLYANESGEKEAQNALVNQQPQQAYGLLSKEYAAGTLSNQGLFLLGMAAKESGNLTESEKYFTELLTKEPNALRVKLELAEVYYVGGQNDKAKAMLTEVKASNPPPKVGENIDRFLAVMEGGGQKNWSAYAGIGMMYDTNANMGPNIDSVLMYNLPFTLSSSAKNTSDWATILKAGGDYIHRLDDRWAMQGSIGISGIDYRTVDNFDSLNLTLSAGPSYHEGLWTVSIPYVLNRVTIGHDQSYYSLSHGIAPQVSYELTQRVLLQASLAYQKKHFHNNDDRDGHSVTFSPMGRYLIDNSSYVTLGGYIGRETSGIDTWANTSHGINAGYFNALSREWSLYVSPSYSKTDYDGIEAAYGTGRLDKHFEVTANVNYQIAPWGTNVTLSYTYTKNSSTIDMYDYNRQQTMLTLTKNF